MSSATLIQGILRQSQLDYGTFTDSVSKIRVSTPESLIDTDFEYGLQAVKWETLQLVNNVPTFYSRTGDQTIAITDIQTRSNIDSIYIYFTPTVPPPICVGSPITVQGLKYGNATAEGTFIINRVVSSNIACYRSKTVQYSTGSVYDPFTTNIYPGTFYTATSYTLDDIAGSITTDGLSPSSLYFNSQYPHGYTSNTLFILTNSIGNKVVNFNAGNITGNVITTATNHGFQDYTKLTYSNLGNPTIPNLVNGGIYYTCYSTVNSFQLSSILYPPTPIAITSSTGFQAMYSTDNATDTSSNVIYSIPSSNTMILFANGNTIASNVFTFNPASNISGNTISFPYPHLQYSGAPVYYSPGPGNTSISGLTSNTTYYVIRLDSSNIALSSNQVFQPQIQMQQAPYAPGQINLNSLGTGFNHQLIMPSVVGEKYNIGTVNASYGCNVFTTSTLYTQSFIKINDVIRIETPSYSAFTVFSNLTWYGSTLPAPYTFAYTSTANASNYVTYISAQYYAPTTIFPDNMPFKIVYASPSTLISYSSTNVYWTYASGIYNGIRTTFRGTPITGATYASSGIFNIQTLINTPGYVFEGSVSNIISPTQFITSNTFYTPNVLFGSNQLGATNQTYRILNRSTFNPLPDGNAYHRAYDGGIELNAPANPYGQIIRQTRRYFRYQPGKSIQVSLSINFNAPLEADYIYCPGGTNVATCFTKRPHRLTQNQLITIDTITTNSYTSSTPNTTNQVLNPANPWTGIYNISGIIDAQTFTYNLSTSLPTASNCPGIPIVYVNNWNGSSIRAGIYDDQNGMFYEYNGSNLYAVKRESVTQLPGYVSVTNKSPLVTALPNNLGLYSTQYNSEIAYGSNVVIRGQTYKVTYVQNNSNFYIQPYYRGISATNVTVSIVTDTKIPQSSWSIDPCNGSGPSGYNIDIHKIQMVYYDYSWYGAGKIRFGFKDNSGIVRYVHEFINNNNAIRAFLRSGNLPARYEIINTGIPTFVPMLFHWGTSAIMDGRYDDDKSYLFTAAGNLISYTAGDTIQIYGTAGISPGTSNYLPGGNNLVTTTTQVTQLYDPYIANNISGYTLYTTSTLAFSSNLVYNNILNIKSGTLISGSNIAPNTFTVGAIQRGPQIPNTTNYVAQLFLNNPVQAPMNYGLVTIGNLTDTIPNLIPLVSIRLSPSVDTSITGSLGNREIINRMMLNIKTIDIITTNDIECRIYLNPILSNNYWTAANSPSLAQLIKHNKNDTIANGIQVFNFRVSGGTTDTLGKRSANVSTQDISRLSSIQNSILGGNNIYPDGPDILTVCAICLDASGVSAITPFTVSSRITWTEAQA